MKLECNSQKKPPGIAGGFLLGLTKWQILFWNEVINDRAHFPSKSIHMLV